MRTKRLSVLTLIAACGIGLGSLGAAPAQAYPLYPAPIILPAPLPAQNPDVNAALQSLAAAKDQSDAVQAQVLTGIHDSPAYKQTLAALDAAQDDMDRAKAATPYSQDEIASLASTILADENRLTRLEQPVLDASPQYKTANANVQAATQSLQYLQQVLAQQQQLAAAECLRDQLEAQRAQYHEYHSHYDRQPIYRHDARYVSQTWSASCR